MYKMNHNKEKGITTMKKKNLIMILLAAALGISLALNIIGYLLN